LPGDHNLSNIYAAHLVTNLLDVSVTQFLEAIQSFKGLEHRLEKVATKGGITYYNDSISTIPQTTIAAIEALKEVHALILGGFDRGIDYTPLVEYLEHSEKGKNINCIVLVGSAGKKISELWSALRSAHVPVGIPS
jgi:UDP-N-acetylmuramoylalanine--D-glutamate ligase